jgi:hypothetical protein
MFLTNVMSTYKSNDVTTQRIDIDITAVRNSNLIITLAKWLVSIPVSNPVPPIYEHEMVTTIK